MKTTFLVIVALILVASLIVITSHRSSVAISPTSPPIAYIRSEYAQGDSRANLAMGFRYRFTDDFISTHDLANIRLFVAVEFVDHKSKAVLHRWEMPQPLPASSSGSIVVKHHWPRPANPHMEVVAAPDLAGIEGHLTVEPDRWGGHVNSDSATNFFILTLSGTSETRLMRLMDDDKYELNVLMRLGYYLDPEK